jgi:hypothetical protein
MKKKYTIMSWDGVSMVFPEATCKTENGEYILQDHTQEDVHYGFPMANVRFIREEPCGP